MRHPLDGILVVALEQAVAAPFATRQLADLGARVIKIERPGGGDFARGYDQAVHGQSSYFVWLNRGKESVVLDVKDDADRALLGRLINQADVFVQNLAPGAADRLDLGATALRSGRQQLIHCSITGYGPDGPYRLKKAYDLLIQCETGLVMSTGTPEVPSKAGISIADIATGMYAFSGILTALYDRERTGRGASIQVAMLDALGELVDASPPTSPATAGNRPGEPGHDICRSRRHGLFQGHRRLSLLRDPERKGMAHPLPGHPEAARPCGGPPASRPTLTAVNRAQRRGQGPDIIEQSLATLTRDEASQALDAAGIASARRAPLEELTRHPQLHARHRWRQVHTPGGDIDALLPPVQVAGQMPVMRAVPALGEHTEAVRTEFGSAPAEDPVT